MSDPVWRHVNNNKRAPLTRVTMAHSAVSWAELNSIRMKR